MKKQILVLMTLAALFTSCAVARLQTDDSAQLYAPTNFENIEVHTADQIDKPYTIIGAVVASVEEISDGSVSVNYLKREAAKLGADGIINLKLEIGSGIGSWGNAITASGTAVKFQ